MSTSGIYTREQYMNESSHVHRHMYTQHNFRKVLCACYFCVVVNGMPIRNDWSREGPAWLAAQVSVHSAGKTWAGSWPYRCFALIQVRHQRTLPSQTVCNLQNIALRQDSSTSKRFPTPSNIQEFKIRQWGAFQSEIMTLE